MFDARTVGGERDDDDIRRKRSLYLIGLVGNP